MTGDDGFEGFEGFASFYRRERDQMVRAVALTLADRDLAADAVDEAFTRAAERWEQLSTVGNRRGWIYRVAVNWATSWRRARRRRPVLPIEQLDREHRDDLPDLDVRETLARLPADQRRTLVLRFVLDLSVEETAAVLGVPPGTVKARTSRTTRALAQRSAARRPEEQPR